jgi:hypothetical protein
MTKRMKFGLLGVWIALVVILAVLVITPGPGPARHPYLPPEPRPLEVLNTRWDDYNMAAPPVLRDLVWSTNRGSEGRDFDLWRVKGILLEGRPHTYDAPEVVDEVSSLANEFGPFHLPPRFGNVWEYSHSSDRAGLAFASDREGGLGGLDIYFLSPAKQVVPFGVNSVANDAYFTCLTTGSGYFASDRGGEGYDIFEVEKPATVLAGRGRFVDLVRVVPELSSPADDTAPYLFEIEVGSDGEQSICMVFASNRPGGQGGYDLWYSRYLNGRWDAPLNLGPGVNSPQDDFRPSVSHVRGEPVLIFSSNRPGGKGGYDLYYMRFTAP